MVHHSGYEASCGDSVCMADVSHTDLEICQNDLGVWMRSDVSLMNSDY